MDSMTWDGRLLVSCSDNGSRQGRSDLLPSTDSERASSLPSQPSLTFILEAPGSEAGGNRRGQEKSKVRAKPQLPSMSGDRPSDSQSLNPTSVRGPSGQGQSVIAGKRRVTDPSPGMVDGAQNLMRLSYPQHLDMSKGTTKSGPDPRSASPKKSEGGEDWHRSREKYRERQTRSGKDF